MKILLAHFTSESNEHVKEACEFKDYLIRRKESMINSMDVRDIFEEANIELIPSLYANGHAAGLVSADAFKQISAEILSAIKDHYNEIDGIYLFLHGASSVIDLPGSSGEHYLLKEIRKIVGKYLPIAIVMDPHGNVTEEFVNDANIVRCFRESPHTDRIETQRIVAKMFVDLLKSRRDIHPLICKLPLMLGGERSVSADEPLRSINQLLDEYEKDERVMSCSYHVGYLRHDDDKCGAAIVVVPNQLSDVEYCKNKCQGIADYVWKRRKDFHFTGIVGYLEDAIEQAMNFEGKPAIITDSGDNITSGARGYNTFVLKTLLAHPNKKHKKVLIAGVTDKEALDELLKRKVNQKVNIQLGVNQDQLSQTLSLSGRIKAIGFQHNTFHEMENIAQVVTLSLDDSLIDVIVVEKSISYCELHQFEAAGIDWQDYDVIVVKQGYIFPELKEVAKFYIMALTEGPTDQRTERIVYRRVMRPMFPLDNI